MIGESIGNFQIVAQIGAGGMGDVFLAEHREIHTKAAIKILHANISTDRSQVERFFNEAVAVSKIKHAGTVRISDCGFTTTGRAYLIMEFLDGETLSARIQRAGHLTLGDIADIGRQIAGVLAATHAEGIVHRDLKPDNIYLIRDSEMARGERVKILDFGIAKLANTNLTGSANSMGTPTYMAPEQWNNSGKVDWRADAYSLGCLVFEMCCGRPPFVATSIGEACAMHLSEPPPHARVFVEDLPAALDELLDRMLAKSADDRPKSMAEIAAGFSQFADSPTGSLYAVTARAPMSAVQHAPTMPTGPGMAGQVAVLPTHQSSAPAVKRGGRGWLLLLGGLLVGGGAAAAVFVAMHGTPAKRETHNAARRDAGAVAVASDAGAGAGSGSDGAHPLPAMANEWVEIDPVRPPVLLGLGASAGEDDKGFRPARKITSPTTPYAIQAHEVTYSELEPYLAANDKLVIYPEWAKDPAKRRRLPATNVSWQLAHDYCLSIQGELPSDEEWEYAARGAARRPYSWGSERLDRQLTHTLVGEGGAPDEAMKSEQDKTPPNAAGKHVFDLVGNVQEWTEGLWRDDTPSLKPEDEAWVEDGDTTFRAIRGIPLHGAKTAKIQADAAAYREVVCATGECKGQHVPDLDSIGFRCVKNAKTIIANHGTGPGPGSGVTALPPPPAKVDAGVIASVPLVDAGPAAANDCTLESCQENAMAGACCAKLFPKKGPPHVDPQPQPQPQPSLPAEPSRSDISAAFAKLQPAMIACAANSHARGKRQVTLHIEPDGHVSDVDVANTPNPELLSCIKAAGVKLVTARSQHGKTAAASLWVRQPVGAPPGMGPDE